MEPVSGSIRRTASGNANGASTRVCDQLLEMDAYRHRLSASTQPEIDEYQGFLAGKHSGPTPERAVHHGAKLSLPSAEVSICNLWPGCGNVKYREHRTAGTVRARSVNAVGGPAAEPLRPGNLDPQFGELLRELVPFAGRLALAGALSQQSPVERG